MNSMNENQPNPLRYLTELFTTDFTSTHLIIALLTLIVLYESFNK